MSFEQFSKVPGIILIGILLLLYFISRKSTQQLFIVFVYLFRNNTIARTLLAIVFYPGTLIHELSHFVMAVCLRLKVREISLTPRNNGNTLILGYVLFEKKDPLRGILVGVAPLFSGIILLWWLHTIHFLGQDTWYMYLIKGYFTFVITTTMFSSEQDLVDLIYLLPVVGIAFGVAVFLHFDVVNYISRISQLEAVSNFMYAVTIYSCISLLIHLIIILLCVCFRKMLSV